MKRTTRSISRLTDRLSSAQKLLLALAGIAGVIYGTVKFVVERELDRYERARQKIGRQEFTHYKERVEKELEKLDQRVDDLEKHR